MFGRIMSTNLLLLLGLVSVAARPTAKAGSISTSTITVPPTPSVILPSNAALLSQVAFLPSPAYLHTMAFSPDGRILAGGLGDGTVQLWDVLSASERAVLQGHADVVESIAFSPDSTLLASGSRDKTIRIWDVAKNTTVFVLQGHTRDVRNVVFSPDGTWLASASIIEALLWRVTTGAQTTILAEGLAPGPEAPYHIAFRHDSAVVAVSAGVERHEIRLWNLKAGKRQDTFECYGRVTTVTFSPDGSMLACGTVNGIVELWKLASHEKLFSLHMDGDHLKFSPDGKIIAAQGWNTIRLRNISTGKEIPILQSDYCHYESDYIFNADGSLVASGGYCADEESGFVELDDTGSGKQIARFKITGIVNNVAFNSAGTVLASSTGAGITLWMVK
jgi:WD40 repeat protein